MYSLNREKEDLEDTAKLSATYHSTMCVVLQICKLTCISESKQFHVLGHQPQLWQVAVSFHSRIGVWRALTVKLAMNIKKIALQSGSALQRLRCDLLPSQNFFQPHCPKSSAYFQVIPRSVYESKSPGRKILKAV